MEAVAMEIVGIVTVQNEINKEKRLKITLFLFLFLHIPVYVTIECRIQYLSQGCTIWRGGFYGRERQPIVYPISPPENPYEN